jgi:hypothetical protein
MTEQPPELRPRSRLDHPFTALETGIEGVIAWVTVPLWVEADHTVVTWPLTSLSHIFGLRTALLAFDLR